MAFCVSLNPPEIFAFVKPKLLSGAERRACETQPLPSDAVNIPHSSKPEQESCQERRGEIRESTHLNTSQQQSRAYLAYLRRSAVANTMKAAAKNGNETTTKKTGINGSDK